MRPILIIDSMNVFIRHFAVNESVTTSGEPCGGVLGFINAIYGLTCQFSPSAIYVVWEQGGGCPRRKKIFPDYKANRIKVKQNFTDSNGSPKGIMDDVESKLWQTKTLVTILKHLPVCQIYVPDTECDDVIGHLIRVKLKHLDALKIVVSSDRDFYQLLDQPNVKLYNPASKSFHDGPIVKVNVGKNEHVEIPARNYALVRTLTGDSSDNIPGVPGLGFKTALKLFPSLLDAKEDHTINKLLEVANQHLKTDKKPLKVYVAVAQSEEVIRRNWQLMFLSDSTLTYSQITKIENTVDNFKPKIDKLGFIKSLLTSKIVSTLNFDAISQQMQICLVCSES